MNIWDLATSGVWAIRPDALRAILSLAAREDITPERVAAAMAYTPQAIAARAGERREDTRAVTMRDGVAILAIDGPIFPRSNLFSDVSGATSLEVLARDLNIALDDPSVSSILLEVDSPGGEVSGVSEFAAMVHAGRERKPIAAYIQDLGASAAYWIVAAASPIVVADTAAVGSIGVVAAIPDPSQRKSSSIEFVSSQSPSKRLDPTTDTGKAHIQSHVDEVADVFVAAVAKYRETTTEKVLADFGQGGLLVGASAVVAGLADQVGSFEQTLKDLATPPQVVLSPPVQEPALSPQKPARPARSTVMGFRERWEQFMNGIDAEVGADGDDPVPVAAIAPHKFSAPDPRDAELVRMRQERDAAKAETLRVRAEAISREATAFADRIVVTEQRAVPAAREAIITGHQQAALDDMNYGTVTFGEGQTTTRVERFEAVLLAGPPHRLTSESKVDALMSVLQGHRDSPEQDANTKADRAELDRLLNMTSTGQTTVSARNGKGA